MKITAGSRGDAAREAKDRAENKYYWDNYQRSKVVPEITREFDSRDEQAAADVRRQIDRLITDGYAQQIFEDDIVVHVTGDNYGNKTYNARDKALGKYSSWKDKHPGQAEVYIRTEGKTPFRWEWRAKFDKSFRDSEFKIKNDMSSYSFDSSDPADIEYFAASAQILKALSKLNWNKILTTDPYEGLSDLYSQLPDEPDEYALRDGGRLDRDIKEADIEDALEEWKKGQKWLYVGTPKSTYSYRYKDTENDPWYDTTTSLMQENDFYKGWYKYVGETDKYYKVVYMPYSKDAAEKMKQGEPPVPYSQQWKDKVRKEDFEDSIYYPITWYGRA